MALHTLAGTSGSSTAGVLGLFRVQYITMLIPHITLLLGATVHSRENKLRVITLHARADYVSTHPSRSGLLGHRTKGSVKVSPGCQLPGDRHPRPSTQAAPSVHRAGSRNRRTAGRPGHSPR